MKLQHLLTFLALYLIHVTLARLASRINAPVEKDAVVIGGGASGTIAALKLKDAGESVAVIEKKGRLGGHTETYHDPVTGGTVDCGVVVYQQLPITHEIFGRYNIPLTKVNYSALPFTYSYADFKTGTLLNVSASATELEYTAAAIEKYYGIVSNYTYLNDGFELPDPIPEDLLLTFGEFVAKYELDAAVFTIASYAQGFGDLLKLPAIYVLKLFNPDVILDQSIGFLTTSASDNSLLYEAAAAELGDKSVFLDSTITSVDRSSCSPKIIINFSTPSGTKTIVTEKLILAISAKLENLSWLDLDKNESSLFNQFENKGYFTALVRNTGLSNSTLEVNMDPTQPYNLPSLPGIYNIEPSGVRDLLHVYYGANSSADPESVKADIQNNIKTLRTLYQVEIEEEPEIAFFSAHDPFSLTVSSEAIAGGFYQKLNALQGCKGTWWTGATFHTHQSAFLWRFSEALVERILKEEK